MASHNAYVRVLFALILMCSFHGALAAETLITWRGEVTDLTEFNGGSLPGSISVGDSVSGTLRFKHNVYERSTETRGTGIYGRNYIFDQSLLNSVKIGELEWVVDSGTVSLTSRVNFLGIREQREFSFDIRESDGEGVLRFPNLRSIYGMGFWLYDTTDPSRIFDFYELEDMRLNPREVDRAGGGIFSSDPEAVNYYSIQFDIVSVDVRELRHPVPVSSWQYTLALILAIVVIVGKKNGFFAAT